MKCACLQLLAVTHVCYLLVHSRGGKTAALFCFMIERRHASFREQNEITLVPLSCPIIVINFRRFLSKRTNGVALTITLIYHNMLLRYRSEKFS